MNQFQHTINIEEIVKLGKLLHQNGDKVLNASSKLSLSTMLLNDLNKAFSLIVDEPEDLVSLCEMYNTSKVYVFQDLKFLHDFIQKTLALKVIYCANNPTILVDITKFRHLKYLELKKIDIESVKGLQGVRGQLESIICVGRKGICTLSQLLASCGGDAGIGFVWDSLKHLVLSYNALEKLDKSLELAPWLQLIDLSHNLITSADELSYLPNLKYVNLGYNKLQRIPTFNKAASHSLKILILKNNHIENLNGLQNLKSLMELDLSYNCLMEHSTLWVLNKILTLFWISLEGNPLSYHLKHRQLSIQYLSTCEFVLDHLPVSRSEKQIIGENRFFTNTFEQSTSDELLVSNSVNSDNPSACINTSTFNEFVIDKSSELTNNLERNLPKSKKKFNIKEATISEDGQEQQELKKDYSPHSDLMKSHLETKQQFLALQQKFAENESLSNYTQTFVQYMGLTSDTNTILNTQDYAINLIKNTQIETHEDFEKYSIMENSETNNEKEEQIEISKEEQNLSEPLLTSDIANACVNIHDPPYDPEEENGDLYRVQRKNNHEVEELFLIITLDDIIEKDSITGKLKCCWSISSVLSCVLGRSKPVTVDIIFDTTRKTRQNRRYFVEPDEAKKIVTTICQRIEKRPMSLKVFICMKCSTHFSHDTEYVTVIDTTTSDIQQLKCPTCRSTLVVETDELSILDMESDVSEGSTEYLSKNQYSKNTTKTNLQHSESFSSIGGTEGRAISVTTSLVHSDSHTQAQVCCSATSLEESRESTPSTNALNRKYESDIEILSNPSQSSIEVLDEASKTHLTPHRKRSSEERRTAIAPSLLTIQDAAPIMTGLTESSSSGSLTDSICTAYENKIIKQINADEKSLNGNNDKETKYAPVTNLTSMLGGLLQSIKIVGNKPLISEAEEASNFLSSNIQYSYTDFSNVDHRIKLHIILNILEHKNEELVFLLKADILMHNAKDTFPGCLVLSTSKVYILKIDGLEGEDPQRWLHKEISWTMDRLRSFAPLPFKQGVMTELEESNKLNHEIQSTITFLCILQDFQKTHNFLFYASDLSLPSSCKVEFTVPEHCTALMHRVLKDCKNFQDGDIVRLLALFSSALLKYQGFEVQLKLSSIIVTTSVLVICNMQWLLPSNKEMPEVIREQAMSNLIRIEHYNSSLTLNFLDEVAEQEESWTLNFISVSAAETVINSIQPPWEELFLIPLQITTCKTEKTEDV